MQYLCLNAVIDGVTALGLSIIKGYLEIVRGLARHSLIDINKAGSNGVTSLTLALTHPDPKIAEQIALVLLSSAKRKPLAINKPYPRTGYTPLHIAIDRELLGIAEELLSTDLAKSLIQLYCPTIDVNIRDKDGNTPLHIAVYLANKKLVDLLAQQPTIRFNLRNRNQKTPLDIAKNESYLDIVDRLEVEQKKRPPF